MVQELFEKLVEPSIWRPTFVCDFPREVSPLARPHRDDPALTEHFDLVAGAVELVTAFSELTDPIEQRAKFELQQQMKAIFGDEVHPMDEEFLRALEHGMPPAGGMGMGVDRLLLVLAGLIAVIAVSGFAEGMFSSRSSDTASARASWPTRYCGAWIASVAALTARPRRARPNRSPRADPRRAARNAGTGRGSRAARAGQLEGAA